MKPQPIKYLPYLFAVLLAAILLIFYKEFLWRMQLHSIFLSNELFFSQSVALPGGFMTWISAYLTQFFYYPALGTAILSVLWFLIIFLYIKTFGNDLATRASSAVLPAALFAVFAQSGYYLFYVKLQANFMAPQVGVLFVLIVAFICSKLKGNVKLFFICIVSVAGYPLFGVYAFLAAFVSAIYGKNIIKLTITVVCSCTASAFLYYYTHNTVKMSELIYAGLPCLTIGPDTVKFYAVPYIFLIIGLLMPLIIKFLKFEKSGKIFAFGLFIALVSGLSVHHYRNKTFFDELKMYRALYSGDFNEALNTAEKCEKPTLSVILYRNIALWKTGSLANKAFTYNLETTKQAAPFGCSLAQTGANVGYYYLGKINFCYRWAIENSVEYGWNIENLTFATRCALLNNEFDLAEKYIGLLSQTLFYKTEAEHLSKFLNNPDLIKSDPEFADIVLMMNYPDKLSGDQGKISQFIYSDMSECNINTRSAREFAAVSALIYKNDEMFQRQCAEYIKLCVSECDLPVHFQEALLFFAYFNNKTYPDNAPFKPEIKAKFISFAKDYQALINRSEHNPAEILKTAYGNTYYFYYCFINN